MLWHPLQLRKLYDFTEFHSSNVLCKMLYCPSHIIGILLMEIRQIFRLIDHFQWNGTFLILGAIVLLNIILGALFRPLLPSSSASEATTTSNQDAVNLDCDVTSSLYKISDKENGNLSLHNSFSNGINPNDMSN